MTDIYEEPTVIETDEGAENGQTKCPKCGATDISLSVKKGVLRCNFCRYEFEAEKSEELYDDISSLQGEVIGSGAEDIDRSFDGFVTFKCESCGETVVISTEESTTARCHWCRNVLSVNEQIPNGAVPDMVLPFSVTQHDAEESIAGFVKKRRFFAKTKFKKEFCTDNVMGVYLPYVVVDANAEADFQGIGEHEVRRYTVTRKVGKDKTVTETYCDADVYSVGRRFDMTVEGLTVESNFDRIDHDSSEKTNNILNSIMPFDTENCVKWDSNYLRGYTSEKRDINIDTLRPVVAKQLTDIARVGANGTIGYYDRGVDWKKQSVETVGMQWKTAYLPVWLYSYRHEKSSGKGFTHYVAVNARTKETMGSVPINKTKLLLVSLLIELLCLILGLLINYWSETPLGYILLVVGVIFFFAMYFRYRNTGARHRHEYETKRNYDNISQSDDYIRRRHRIRV